MIRITFQFIPLTPDATEVELERASDRIKRVDELNGDMTVVYFQDGSRLEYDIDGNLRYSVRAQSMSDKDLDSIYESALRVIEEVHHGTQSYSVCLILNDENVVNIYIDEVDDIERFSDTRFNNPSPEYTELGDQTIKLSFGRSGRAIVF